MLMTMAVSLLSLLLLGVANGTAMGDLVYVFLAVSAIILVVSRLRDEQDLEGFSEPAAPHGS